MSEAVHEQTSGGFLNVITFGGMSRARKAGLIAGEQEIANKIPGVVTRVAKQILCCAITLVLSGAGLIILGAFAIKEGGPDGTWCESYVAQDKACTYHPTLC